MKGKPMKNKAVFWLKLSFLTGAVVDAVALIPMLVPPAAKIFWGFDNFTGIYYFAMGMGASLMLAWTILLGFVLRRVYASGANKSSRATGSSISR